MRNWNLGCIVIARMRPERHDLKGGHSKRAVIADKNPVAVSRLLDSVVVPARNHDELYVKVLRIDRPLVNFLHLIGLNPKPIDESLCIIRLSHRRMNLIGSHSHT